MNIKLREAQKFFEFSVELAEILTADNEQNVSTNRYYKITQTLFGI